MNIRHSPRLNITLPPDIHARLGSYASQYGTSRSGVIELALRDFFAKQPEVKAGTAIIKHNSDPTKIIPSAKKRGIDWREFLATEGKDMDTMAALIKYETDQYSD